MCFIPDDAARRLRQLSPNARQVYIAHCDFRIHKYRVSFADEAQIVREYGVPLGSVRNAHTELKKKGWLRFGPYYVELLVGDFRPVDKKHPRKPIPPLPLLTRGERLVPAIPESVKTVPETVSEIPESVSEIPESGNGTSKGSRARDPSLTSDPSTHTRTDAPRLFREPEATGPRRVCVSQYPIEVRKAYADDPANKDRNGDKLGGGWLKTSGDGSSDEMIGLWLKGREQRRERAERESRIEAAGLSLTQCPDCFGSGRALVEQDGRRVAGWRCDHARLFERLDGRDSSAVA